METLLVGDLFISSEAFREAIEKEMGEDFGPMREVAWNEGETPEDQHHVQQIPTSVISPSPEKARACILT